MINNDNKDVISALHYLLEDLKLNLLRHYKGKEEQLDLEISGLSVEIKLR